ncbi:uncharacterized protein [Paramisgurnus dabryanus]|uniref:uncharacterized protein n=1 Tax=Paramisgurnus dabryanus TaxID=90735 RepID=UPI0031F45E3E
MTLICHEFTFPKKTNCSVLSSGFTVVLVILIEGASVKVHPGGNITLHCTIKDDREISWIITNGNQTFVRILRIEHLYGDKHKPDPSFTHPDYEGRIIAVSSLTHTHSLILMNITSNDLMLYCCTDCKHEQTYCTKLDFEGDESAEDVEHRDTEDIIHDSFISPLLPVLCVLISLLLLANICLCWTGKRLKTGCARTSDTVRSHNTVQNEKHLNDIKKTQDDWTLAEVLYAQI